MKIIATRNGLARFRYAKSLEFQGHASISKLDVVLPTSGRREAAGGIRLTRVIFETECKHNTTCLSYYSLVGNGSAQAENSLTDCTTTYGTLAPIVELSQYR